MLLTPVAHVENDFPDKFGLPRQSAAAETVRGRIVFEKPFANPDALRGLEGFDRIWLIWGFDVPESRTFHATVRPPKLGGNTRIGVFATRSPFRPNPLGLSCVHLEGIDRSLPALLVSGLDMKSGTPVYDIKPYLPYTDAWPEAKAGFTADTDLTPLEVRCPEALMGLIPEDKRETLTAVLRADPRPGYQKAPGSYGLRYAGKNIRFSVDGLTLTVTDIQEDP